MNRSHTIVVLIALGLVAAAATALAFAGRALHAHFVDNTLRAKAAAGVQSSAVITEQDLRGLPEPMARYLRFSGVLGKKRISAVRLTHSGTFKTAVDKPWMRIRGEYYITTKTPSFAWYGKLRMAPGLNVIALDSYANGQGHMLVKALSIWTIVDDRSEQVAQSAFGRCVAELTMAPTFFLDRDRVRCEQTGPDEMRCTITDGAFSTNATLAINADGSLDRIVVMRHFDRGGGRATLEQFTGKSSRPKSYAGLVIGSKMDGFWNLAEGDFHYVSFDIDTVEFE